MSALDGGAHIVVLNWRDRRHPAAGGSELYCERVARELVSRGYRVTIVTSSASRLPSREVLDDYEIRRMGTWRSVYPLALAWLIRHRRTIDAVVDSANGVPFFSPLVLGHRIPVILLVHRVHQDLFARALPPTLAKIGRWLEGPATRVVYGRRTTVVLSPSTRTAARRLLRLRGPVRVVPGGADTRELVPERALHPRVVVVGRLSPYKRLNSLVAAMARVQRTLPTAELHLVGDGSERVDLEALAARTGAAVSFHGRLSDADRDAVLATAWLTVSASDGGDWALSLLEANAAGVPALARTVTGVRDTVRHGETGWLLDESADWHLSDGDGAQLQVDEDEERVTRLSGAIAHALEQLHDPATADRMRAASRDWALRFSWQRAADGILAALRSEELRAQRARDASDRRAGNDLSVIIDMPRAALPAAWDPRESACRREDRWVVDGERALVLLTGADEVDAHGLLRRLTVDPDHPSVRVSVARHADVVDHSAFRPEHVTLHYQRQQGLRATG